MVWQYIVRADGSDLAKVHKTLKKCIVFSFKTNYNKKDGKKFIILRRYGHA